jgi:hypothetical protein
MRGTWMLPRWPSPQVRMGSGLAESCFPLGAVFVDGRALGPVVSNRSYARREAIDARIEAIPGLHGWNECTDVELASRRRWRESHAHGGVVQGSHQDRR